MYFDCVHVPDLGAARLLPGVVMLQLHRLCGQVMITSYHIIVFSPPQLKLSSYATVQFVDCGLGNHIDAPIDSKSHRLKSFGPNHNNYGDMFLAKAKSYLRKLLNVSESWQTLCRDGTVHAQCVYIEKPAKLPRAHVVSTWLSYSSVSLYPTIYPTQLAENDNHPFLHLSSSSSSSSSSSFSFNRPTNCLLNSSSDYQLHPGYNGQQHLEAQNASFMRLDGFVCMCTWESGSCVCTVGVSVPSQNTDTVM